MKKKNKRYPFKVFMLFFLSQLLFLVGCVWDPTGHYRGNNIELQVIATNSILGVRGHESDKVYILEEDDFGRVLFVFQGLCQNTKEMDGRALAILISQKTTEQYSYFYADVNYIITELSEYKTIDKNMIAEYFTDEQIENLKVENDWNKEFSSDILFKVKIAKYKEKTISEQKLEKAFSTVSPDFHRNYTSLLTTDKNGKSLYYMRGKKYDKVKNKYVFTDSYIFIFNQDGTIDEHVGIEKLDDLWDYREQLKSFKEKNNWNK